MKLYVNINKPYLSKALKRIEDAIVSTSPYQITTKREADFHITPVVNINDTRNLSLHKSIIWQLCYKSAGGTEEEWQNIWSQSLGVVSYYNLPTSYLRLPLGYDPNIFYLESPYYGYTATTNRPYDILVTGYLDGGEVIKPLMDYFRTVVHIGPNFDLGEGYYNYNNISDDKMRELYNRCKYVSGLRYVEGFELPILEGAACGCIPITFDLECYKHWFYDMAIFVKSHKELQDFQDIEVDRNKINSFTWSNVMEDFWGYVRERLGRRS